MTKKSWTRSLKMSKDKKNPNFPDFKLSDYFYPFRHVQVIRLMAQSALNLK